MRGSYQEQNYLYNIFFFQYENSIFIYKKYIIYLYKERNQFMFRSRSCPSTRINLILFIYIYKIYI